MKTTFVGLRLDDEQAKDLKRYCKEDKVGMSFFIRARLDEAIKRRKKQTKLL